MAAQKLSSGVHIVGFVDLQINGWAGVDFTSLELTEESCALCFRSILASGTVAFLPTVITTSLEVYSHVLPILAKVGQREEFSPSTSGGASTFLGVHLEGPFISSCDGAVGCHPKEHTQKPSVPFLQTLLDLAQNQVRMLTLAPELPQIDEVIQFAKQQGIVVALGHHLGSTEDIRLAAESGASLLTHLGNGVPQMLPRHINPAFSSSSHPSISSSIYSTTIPVPLNLMLFVLLFLGSELKASIITDGYHLPPEMIKVFLRTKGLDGLLLVSDATAVGSFPPGEYTCLGRKVIVENGCFGPHVRDASSNYLAGSAASLLQCANHLLSLKLVTVDEVVKMAFDSPLSLLGPYGKQIWTQLLDFYSSKKGNTPMLIYSEGVLKLAVSDSEVN